MPLDSTGLLAAVRSHASRLGRFDRVNGHEPAKAPGSGLTVAVWVQTIGPAQGASGLDATSGRIELAVRIYTSANLQPADAIDPAVLDAADALLRAYSGDFTLGGRISYVDLLGQYGTPLSGTAGWVQIDGKMHRVFTITLPLIVPDLWAQTP